MDKTRTSKQLSDRASNIQKLLNIMRDLRNPETGCQWDLEQTFESLSKYTIEEAYEVTDAVLEGDVLAIKEELGDLLLQVVFFSQIASDKNLFNFSDVVESICKKMIRRHPHIFSNNKEFKTAQQQKESWDLIKSLESRAKQKSKKKSLLSDITKRLPPLLKSKKIQEKVSTVGFDWEKISDIQEKIKEELIELDNAIKNEDEKNAKEELGDLLFTIVNLGRRMNMDCEEALIDANKKFTTRFNKLELAMMKKNKSLSKENILEMENIWIELKKSETRL